MVYTLIISFCEKRGIMSMDRLTVWYLSHSGFAVLCGRRLFVFDYYKDTPRGGFAKGVIAPEDIKE